MFNLIISIIAIALVVILTGATIYYFGSDISEKKIEAEAAKLRNEATQIAAAVKLYTGDGNEFGPSFQLQDLVDMGYLSKLPSDWEPGDDKIMHVLKDPEKSEIVCFVANRQAGYTFDAADADVVAYSQDASLGIPLCTKAGLDALVPCCSDGA